MLELNDGFIIGGIDVSLNWIFALILKGIFWRYHRYGFRWKWLKKIGLNDFKLFLMWRIDSGLFEYDVSIKVREFLSLYGSVLYWTL